MKYFIPMICILCSFCQSGQGYAFDTIKDSTALMSLGEVPLKADVFRIIIHNQDKTITYCTASLLKFSGACSLVTNSHCFEHYNGDPITVEYDFNLIDNALFSKASTKLSYIEPQNELAQIELPQEMAKKYCAKMKDISFKKTAKIISDPSPKIIIGYTSHGLNSDATSDIFNKNYKTNVASGITSLIKTSFPNISNFIQIKYLRVYPGNSGGLVIDKDWEPLGIVTRAIAKQDTPWIIPIEDVFNFIERSKNKKTTTSPIIQQYQQKIQGETILVGENITIKPGENVTIKPGEGLVYEDGACEKQILRWPLHELLTRQEGIIDVYDKLNRDLLAARCKENSSWEQIDGINDLLDNDKFICGLVANLPEKNKIYRNTDSYPDEATRFSILDRLAGTYSTDQDNNLLRYNRYRFNPSETEMLHLKPIEQMGVDGSITIDASKKHISVGLAFPIYLGLTYIKTKHAQESVGFDASFSKDGKIITLTPDKTSGIPLRPLVCDNRNAMKLICVNNTETLSFSLSNTKKKQMDVQLAWIINPKESDEGIVIDHFFGTQYGK